MGKQRFGIIVMGNKGRAMFDFVSKMKITRLQQFVIMIYLI
jgi:hypothetical protein